MTGQFDDVAKRFAHETDQAMERNGYTRGEVILALARQSIPQNAHVLDYGCGPGRLAMLLARCGFKVCGVDTSEGMIAQARMLDRSGLELEFETIPDPESVLQPGSCDAIVCSSVIEYVVEPDHLLRLFHRALRDPGVLIISFANKSSLYRRSWERDTRKVNPMYAPHNHVWSWRGFRELLTRNHFRTSIGPTFFESPADWRPWGRMFRRLSWVGSLGAVVACPER